jgi:hypothetical protein
MVRWPRFDGKYDHCPDYPHLPGMAIALKGDGTVVIFTFQSTTNDQGQDHDHDPKKKRAMEATKTITN